MAGVASRAAGAEFAQFVFGKYGVRVASSPPSGSDFSLLVAFGRCRFRLEEEFVKQTLRSILGNTKDSFNACLIDERIFLFTISCKEVGFEVCKIRSFECADYKLSFHLFNEAGLASANALVSASERQSFPWMEVGPKQKVSFADMVKKPASVLSGANSVPIGKFQGSSSAASIPAPRTGRKSVFDILKFPRTFVFDRIIWPNVDDLAGKSAYRSLAVIGQESPGDQDTCLDLQLGLSSLSRSCAPTLSNSNSTEVVIASQDDSSAADTVHRGGFLTEAGGNSLTQLHSANPDPTSCHPSATLLSAMAYQRADPRIFVPQGLEAMEVQGRPPMARVVCLRPGAKNNDLAIVTINPMPEVQDYREDEYVVNAISSFGRVINWVDDPDYINRLLIRARVSDLEAVPNFLVCTEREDHHGESWIVQCEILSGELLGGLLADEDPALGPGDIPPNGPFDFFGFVNEYKEEEEEANELLNNMNNIEDENVVQQPVVEVNLPVLNHPMENFLAEEIDEDQLIDVEMEQTRIGLVVPPACPDRLTINCPYITPEAGADEKDDNIVPPSSPGDKGSVSDSSLKKRARKKAVVVESQVRRSPRFKELKKGFKSPQCKNRSCLGCNSAPPSLSTKTIRKIGTEICNIDPAKLTDEELTKKKKMTTPVGRGPSLDKGESSNQSANEEGSPKI
ncbi:unnamed protein product [Miscanthus lutarioriparius]|uniref:Uncharacterized protein n=1 Tax=Miscanthus lutarioriparius TaxID=422564 RepID=A0A811R952_9POAL|nr:unnamed protein product [Miscanthus lutarioriparius]